MTRNDYWKFAEMLNKLDKQDEFRGCAYHSCSWEQIVEKTADIFQEDNPRFNRERFYEACGIGEEE